MEDGHNTSEPVVTPETVEGAARAVGLTGLATVRDEGRSLVLLGLSRDGWMMFTVAPEFGDGAPDPLDRWSVRVIGGLARELGGEALFPFGGPPYQPFLRWAAASGRMWPSALGMSIHDEHGVWMSFRGALAFEGMGGVVEPTAVRPCDGCASTPCLRACPVDAFSGEGYDVAACTAHVASREGAACRERGCLARRACWVGQDRVPEPERAAFHMAAFLRAQA